MENLEIYNRFKEVPQNAQKPINGGRMKGCTDINPMWRLKCLTEQFGACGIGWYYKPVKKWTEQAGDEILAFVDIELFVKADSEWSMPISGTGGSSLLAKEKGGLFASDECFKMATTDAISVACKQLGIGADIYWSADSSKYDKPQNTQQTPQTTTQTTGQSASRADLLKTFESEIHRTGKSLKWFLEQGKASEVKFLKTEKLIEFNELLKSQPTKE